jgi:hypothetical protein
MFTTVTVLRTFLPIAMVWCVLFNRILCDHSCGVEMTMLRKMACGYVFAALSMVVAGGIEDWRKQLARDGDYVGPSICSTDDPPQMTNLSIFWQIPQFMLVNAVYHSSIHHNNDEMLMILSMHVVMIDWYVGSVW